MEFIPNMALVVKNMRLYRPGTHEKIKYYYSAKGTQKLTFRCVYISVTCLGIISDAAS